MFNQYDYPSASKGGTLEVDVRDFAAANQISLGEFKLWLSLFPAGGRNLPRMSAASQLHASA